MSERKKYISEDTGKYPEDRAPLCETMHQQMDTLRVCGETANIILIILTDQESLMPNADPKSVVDEADAVLSELVALSDILQAIQKALT